MEKQIFFNDDFIDLGAHIGVNIVEATIEKIRQQGMISGMIFKKQQQQKKTEEIGFNDYHSAAVLPQKPKSPYPGYLIMYTIIKDPRSHKKQKTNKKKLYKIQ